ncbi:MAG TPA: LamG-like jellyroll fold domain-containing protein [Verrucomicrobiae bacterium]
MNFLADVSGRSPRKVDVQSKRFFLSTFLVLISFQWGLMAQGYLRGSLGIHDPSAVIECNGLYYVFGTGQGILSKSSTDKTYWVTGPSVFANSPSWTTNAVPGFTGDFWAPDISYFNGQYHLYYAVSTFGSQVSGIGLATNPTLDPNDPSYQWTDQGPVIESTTGSAYNCIDPSVTFDASSNLWMSFGSFWTGIKLIQLNATTGLRSTSNTTVYSLANDNAASGDPIEGSYLYHYGNYYYLFVNWGTCCSGLQSTYNIRVGRSANIIGPFLDRNNVNMLSSGGTLFLQTTGKYLAPGQVGIINENGADYFGYHYLDADANGAPTFDLEPLSWTSDGWPAFTNDWSAAYHFRMDARDDDDQYYGLLENGVSIIDDPLLGDSVALNGNNQYVSLPAGLANAQTFATVFKWNGGAAWQRVFDFGNGTNSYAFLTPLASTGFPRFTITSSGLGGEQHLDAVAALPTNVWTHIAVTTDGSRGILYVNGAAVATNTSMSLVASEIVPTNVWFGRSQFSADPYFNGQISSVRIDGRALSADEIVAPQPEISAPLADSTYQPGETISFAGGATDFADSPLSASNLTWSIEFCDTNGSNVVAGPVSGVGSGSFTIPASGEEATNGFYQVLLVATDLAGRAATNCVNLYPNPTNTDWTSFYPFTNGAADANGNYNGSLLNGATTPSDPIRGPVLNLSGSSQYMSLPAGIGAMRTFSAWVKWGGGNDWQRIFDFGQNTTSYAMLTAKANSNKLRFEITPNGAGETRDLDSPNRFPTNVWTHVAVTLDGRQAVMFINGQAVAVNASVNLLPSDVMGSANYLGRSQFSADPYFNGKMDDVEISSEILPIEGLTASSIGISNSASGLTLTWPGWTNGLGLYTSSGLGANAGWTLITNAPVMTNGVNILTLTPTNSQTFFRLQLP